MTGRCLHTMTNPNLTEEQRRYIRKAHRLGHSVDQIRKGVQISRKSNRRPSRSTVYRVLSSNSVKVTSKRGSPPKYFNKARRNILTRVLKREQRKSLTGVEITCKRLNDLCGFDCSISCTNKELNRLQYTWKRPQGLPDLTPGDIIDRRIFCKKFKNKSTESLKRELPLVLDEKLYVARLQPKGRKFEQRRHVRGGFTKRGTHSVFARPRQAHQPGKAPAIKVNVAGVLSGNSVSFYFLKGKLNSRSYIDVIKKVTKNKRAKTICVDNHTSHTSKFTRSKLVEMGVKAIQMPKRSPNLMPLDFCVWSIVRQRMNSVEQSKNFQKKYKNKNETLSAYKKRLKNCAAKIPPKIVDKIWGEWKRRFNLCFNAHGDHFRE